MKRFIAICTHVPSTHLSPSIWICQTPIIHTIHICMGAWDVPFTPRTLSYTHKSEGEREGFRLSSFWCKWQLLIQMQSSGYIRLQTHGVFVCLDSCKSKLSIQMQSFKTAKYEVTAHCKKNFLIVWCCFVLDLQSVFLYCSISCTLMELNVLLGNNGGD